MSKITDAVALAKKWAADNSHGYDQSRRWGPDYDCSSFLITVWETVGVPVKTSGATYTGNMRSVFLRCGFELVTDCNLTTGAGLEAGDVLLNDASHTAMHIGNGQLVQASINEHGGVSGGQTGDQTGKEIAVGSYYNFPWSCVLRYAGVAENATTATTDKGDTYTVKTGDSWWGIAFTLGMDMNELAKINGRSTSDTIYPWQVLKLNAETVGDSEDAVASSVSEDGVYIVKAGDTLMGICKAELGNAWLYKEVAELNGITDPNRIYPGQKIKLWEDGCKTCMLP